MIKKNVKYVMNLSEIPGNWLMMPMIFFINMKVMIPSFATRPRSVADAEGKQAEGAAQAQSLLAEGLPHGCGVQAAAQEARIAFAMPR